MTKTIMVVEDDQDIRKHMNRLLRSEGYGVVLAENGRVALDQLAILGQIPDLIILDLMMPIMDGFAFRLAQAQDVKIASIPVIIMTADGHIEEKSLRTGVQGSIRKPADIETILAAVKKIC